MTEDRADIHDELVQEFYGINPGTFKVDSVAVTRSGKLWQWTDRGYQLHQLQGSDVLAEILALTGLIELVDLHPKTPNLERHKILADLTKKALNMLENRGEKGSSTS
ncbi:MAG: hypothetical protein E8A46_14850 [Bradyrhizobium sp.]|uniref:hypothetical protein n=1 Tax=Bradyrhizobium sp. TaxID=376 RepID=UPI001212705B|nr:hypothetical protein [Bradyrhizobium sp.]THD51771.1 MAG: hypothetical protein E8A46_14850 [Bradyrhizobium sp.]